MEKGLPTHPPAPNIIDPSQCAPRPFRDKLPPGPPRPSIKRTANLSVAPFVRVSALRVVTGQKWFHQKQALLAHSQFAGLQTGPARSPPAQNERADSPWTHEATAPRGENGRLIPPALGEDDSLGGGQGSECYPGRKLRTALRKLHVDSTQSPGWKREGHSQSCFAGAVSLPTALKEPLGKAATSGLWGPKEAKWQSVDRDTT
ncbi:uncharacterized protein LOC134739920 isoform X2 [Pongo pygmaeus]|uniref:uncharacterized protein LOC134739920 isoform X2 n=1 Tax=Pongo pygmaeus TaxID=9600 RepID=UPI00300D809E